MRDLINEVVANIYRTKFYEENKNVTVFRVPAIKREEWDLTRKSSCKLHSKMKAPWTQATAKTVGVQRDPSPGRAACRIWDFSLAWRRGEMARWTQAPRGWAAKPGVFSEGQRKLGLGRQVQFSSVQFSRSVMSDSLQHHEPQHARPPCPSPTPRVHPNPCPLNRWYHPTISSSVIPFSSCPQSFPASG